MGMRLWHLKTNLPHLRGGFDEAKKELGVSKPVASRAMMAVESDPATASEIQALKEKMAREKGERGLERVAKNCAARRLATSKRRATRVPAERATSQGAS